jgi:hypothetical protein
VPHRFFETQLNAVRSDDATRFLATVLKRVQTEVSQSRGLGVSVYSENATLFTQLVDLDFSQLSFPGLGYGKIT